MCAIGLPLWALMMLSSAAVESSILCSLHGYFMFSIGGTSLLNIGILSVNYYFCVVKYTLYDRVYTTRNICILLCVVWLIWPIFLLFPLFEIWSEFTFDQLRFICSPLNGSYRNAVGIVDFLLSCLPILFCYVEILRTSKITPKWKHTSKQKSSPLDPNYYLFDHCVFCVEFTSLVCHPSRFWDESRTFMGTQFSALSWHVYIHRQFSGLFRSESESQILIS